MTVGAGHESSFSGAARAALSHLSATSGLRTWMLCRDNGSTFDAICVVDPSESVRTHQRVDLQIVGKAGHSVVAQVDLPDGQVFGSLVGLGDASPGVHTEELAGVLGRMLGALVASDRALTMERRDVEIRSATLDPLTGLATRQGWEQRLRHDDRFCGDFGEPAAVMVIELEEAKSTGEQQGHTLGDEQLHASGLLLRDVLGGSHYAARISGDRLGVLIIGIDERQVGELERSLRAALQTASIPAAIGVGMRMADQNFEAAMVAAEAGLEKARSDQRTAMAAMDDTTSLANAIERGVIRAYFQPIVDLRTGEVVAIEALARWQDADGVREPDRFLRQIQQAGLLGALFDRILDDGLEHLAQFRHIVPNLRLAVNFEFDSKPESQLLASVDEHLRRHNLPPDALSLELSERQTFDLPASLRRELTAVADLGVKLMLDDFGTGFASLETLTSLPISGVKLDRRFTGQVVNGDREPAVVKAMISLAAEAGIAVIAEGIETQMQCDRLVRLGCRLGQGYLFALPQPADSLATVLSAPLVSTF